MNAKYKQLFDLAFSLHSENKFNDAKLIYEKLLEINPDDVNVLNLYGVLCIKLSNNKKAVQLLSKAFILSKSVYACVNLAKAYLSDNQIENAIKIMLTIKKEFYSDDLCYTLAIAYKKAGDLNNAIKYYNKTLELNQNHYNAMYNLALLYRDTGKIDDAVLLCHRAISLNENAEDFYVLLSSLYEIKNDIKNAVKYLEKALKLSPDEYLYMYNLAVLYSRINDISKAEFYYNKVLEADSNHIQSLVNLSILYRKSNIDKSLLYLLKAYKLNSRDKNVCLNLAQIYKYKYMNQESMIILNKFIQNSPLCHEAYSLMAMNYMDLGDYNEALKNYERAIELSPGNLNYLHGKSSALKYLGRYDEAKKIMENIVKSDSSSIQSAVTLGMYYLAENNFEEGMKLYLKRSNDTKFKDIFKEKVWTKADKLDGKDILLFSDCGLGDTIMFSRYIPILSEIAKSIVLITDKDLKSIIQNSYPYIKVLSKTEKIPDKYDLVMPVMNLPYALNMDFKDIIPYSEGYLKDDSELTSNYSKLDIFNTNKKKIGLFWQGNKRIFKNRALDTSYINKIIETDNNFYSFQLDKEYESEKIVQLNKYIKDYNDTASLLKNIDILITIDSSIVHMAGALGVKTYLLLPYTPEWRWYYDGWYKSVKIFKQEKINDWSMPVSEVINEIK